MNDKHSNASVLTIDCERVFLRQYTPEDLDAIYEITLQPEIREFLPDWVSSKEQRNIWLNKYEIPENDAFRASMPEIGGNILRMVVVLKETGRVIGWVVSGLKEELPEPNREIGYGISNQYVGHGYATEAARGVIRFLFDKTDTEMINAIARIDNPRSNSVIGKLGFKYVGDAFIDGHMYHHYTMRGGKTL